MKKATDSIRAHRVTAGVVLLILGLGLAACVPKACKDRSGEQEVRDATSRINKKVSPEAYAWPQDLPEGIPEFTQGRVAGASKGLTANGTSWTINLADVEEGAFDAYFESLQSAGWQTDISRTDDSGTYTASTESLDLKLTFSGNQGTLVVRLRQF